MLRRTVLPALVVLVAACGADDGNEGNGGEAGAPASPPRDGPPAGPSADDGRGTAAGGAEAEVCWTARRAQGDGVAFAEVTERAGLVEPLVGMYGHAAAAADVDGDNWTDLFVAGFADREPNEYRHRGATGPSPDRLLLGGPGGFTVSEDFPGELARTSGATFADLDGDGDLDLVAVRNPREGDEIAHRPTTVYENRDGTWSAAATLLPDTAARSVATLDIDRDGLLDLAIAGDRFGGSPTRLLRNTGDLTFEDATDAWGVPDDLYGLALATVDLDGDGWLDMVVSGEERVLRGGPDGFEVVTQPVLRWEVVGEEDDPAGIAIGDLDGDGRPDLVVGQHFNSTVDDGARIPVRVFLNRSRSGTMKLVEVTEEAGSPALPTKSPHVAVADVDNDGLADVVTSAASDDGVPLVLRNRGVTNGVPRFDVAGGPGDGEYWVTGVTEDIDRDGRVDLLLVAWEPSAVSPLLRGVGASGGWVEIDLAALGPDITGARIEARAGGQVVATGWAASTTGYAAGASPVVHLGLGQVDGDVELTVAPVGGEKRSIVVPADSRAAVGGC
ncbi:MAG TPA: CRTAC1 family protein [Acidimicrobiales bacterium]